MRATLLDYSESRMRSDDHNEARRRFLVASSLGISGAVYSAGAYACALGIRSAPAPVDEGSLVGEQGRFPPIHAGSELQGALPVLLR